MAVEVLSFWAPGRAVLVGWRPLTWSDGPHFPSCSKCDVSIAIPFIFWCARRAKAIFYKYSKPWSKRDASMRLPPENKTSTTATKCGCLSSNVTKDGRKSVESVELWKCACVRVWDPIDRDVHHYIRLMVSVARVQRAVCWWKRGLYVTIFTVTPCSTTHCTICDWELGEYAFSAVFACCQRLTHFFCQPSQTCL